MKISLIATKGGWHTQELIKKTRKRKIELEVLSIKSFEEYEKIEKQLGDVVIWFSSFLKTLDKKSTFFHLMKELAVINPDCQKFPFLTRKFFQQKYLEKFSSLSCIPTFYFQDKKELSAAIPKKLKFPIIQKPDYGSQGDQISLLKSKKDIRDLKIEISDFIYQNFISNDGDFRVFVVGGKILGAIKRVARSGGFLNNVSKGGHAETVKDLEILSKLERIALTATSIFDLPICGVDIIYDKKTKKYRLMEINTNPEWKGFQGATGINVAEKIIDYCVSVYDRKRKIVPVLVKEYFDKNYEYLNEQKFHYASRMWLWTGEKAYHEKLKDLESYYLEISDDVRKKKFKEILAKKSDWEESISGEVRKKYSKKYPQLSAFNQLLFKNLFSEKIYKKSLKPVIEKLVPMSEFIALKEKLEKDREAIATLSTFAVNYFYNLNFYSGESKPADPMLFLSISREKYKNLENHPELKIYMLTHAIIGESRFYSEKIVRHEKIYTEIMIELENAIKERYFELPLDVKFEFLVCANICGYSTDMKKIIMEEADRSLADNGNFLISRLNDAHGFLYRNIMDAEHRNVLYMMANSEYKKAS